MTNDRFYRPRRPSWQALTELRALSEVQFDPEAVEALHQHFGEVADKHEQAA